jgi:sigma-B regulation protein RsbU (phosphoserine phosphatase)
MAQILVLDDNNDVARLVQTLLERYGFEVVMGRNGQEGLAILSSLMPDAIISNWLMPHMDGMTFLDHVRLNPAWSSIPFAIMTALSSEDDRQQAIDRGANAFLAKPFRFADLDNVLRNLGLKAG